MRVVRAVAKQVLREIFRKKDFYVAFILVGVILLYVSQLKFYDVSNTVRYIREVGLALIFLFSILLTVPLAARQLPDERQNRTLAVLLAKPVSRFEFILGKFAGVTLAGCACFLIFYAVFAVFALGGGAMNLETFLQTGILFCFCLVLVSSMVCALSQKLTTAANIAVSLLFYFMMSLYGAKLDVLAGRAAGVAKLPGTALYYALPHFEFFDMRQRLVHDWGPVSWALVGLLALYTVVYVAIFLTAGWLRFRRESL